MAEVADEWAKYLEARHPGRVRYFKLDEALTLDGEFRHWREDHRDEKIRQMAGVIDRSDLFEMAVVIDLAAFGRVFGHWEIDAPGHHSLKHPYLMLCEYVLSSFVTEAIKRGVTKRVEIVYDNHTKFRPIFAKAYEQYLLSEEGHPERQAVMPYQPWFRDDRDFVMLQAADMLAGDARLTDTDDKAPPLIEGICQTLKASGHFKLIGEDDMRAMDRNVRSQIPWLDESH